MDAKSVVAEKAVKLVRDGMTIGLGSGSTASMFIRKLGELVRAGLKVNTVASSLKSEKLARELGIRVCDPSAISDIDLAFDGADQVDTKSTLVKGGGGSLLREKMLAYASRQFHVLVDESKLVEKLGTFPIPVEVVPFGVVLTLRHIRSLGCEPAVRMSGANCFVTDNGNQIIDCRFEEINDAATLDVKLRMIPGVVETGIFSSRIVTSIFIGYPNGDVKQVMVN